MKRRLLPSLLAAALCLLCLAGCAADATPPAPAYEGTWYFAQNAVACQISQGMIYEDDLRAEEGQSLRGVYSEAEDHIEAHLRGVGGVQVPRALYVVQTDAGEVLRDSADGTVYFYRDALSALAALEAAEEAAEAKASGAPGGAPDLSDGGAQPSAQDADGPDEPVPSAPPSPDSGPSDEPQTASTAGDMVWISRTGSKYHSNAGCSGMKNPSQITKAEAESRGYTPCKRCY